MGIRLTVNPGPKFERWMAGLADRFDRALDTAMRMTAYFLEETARADIARSGNFGPRWTDGLHVSVEGALGNMKLYMYHERPEALIFEKGGVIHGAPLLWIPLSGTNAAGIRASAFSGGLKSSRYPRKSGRPLLFSVTDREPKYFGIPSVTIPKKWHLHEDAEAVIGNFRNFFQEAWSVS